MMSLLTTVALASGACQPAADSIPPPEPWTGSSMRDNSAPETVTFQSVRRAWLRVGSDQLGGLGETIFLKVALDSKLERQLFLGRVSQSGVRLPLSVPRAAQAVYVLAYDTHGEERRFDVALEDD
jgi:hypothetical protein